MSNVSFENFCNAVDRELARTPDDSDLRTAKDIYKSTISFLDASGFGMAQDGTSSLESLDTLIKTNSGIQLTGDNLAMEHITEFVKKVMPQQLVGSVEGNRVQASLTKQIGRIVSGNISASAAFSGTREVDTHRSLAAIASRSAMAGIMADASVGVESFGMTMDSISADARLNIVLTVMRAYKSLNDRVLARIAQSDVVVTVKIPENEVYDLEKSANASSAIRNGGSHRQPMINLLRDASAVNTAAKAVVLDSANDTGTPSAMYGETAIVPGVKANLFDLSYDANRVGFNATDYTDILSEGGTVSALYVQVTKTDTPDVVEVFKIDTGYNATSRFTALSNAHDSGERAAVMRLKAGSQLTDGGLDAAGAATVIFAGITDYVYQLDINFNATLNLKTGEIQGNGSVTGAMKAKADGSAPAGASAEETLANAISSLVILGFEVDVTYSEENLRKTTVAVRQNVRQYQFEIPVGRSAVVDCSLQQSTPEDVLDAITSVNSLGNTARTLAIFDGHMTDVAARNVYEDENASSIGLFETVAKEYAAGSRALPRVVLETVNVASADIQVMRESEKPTELHAHLRARIQSVIAQAYAKSLYRENLEPGETPVVKIICHQVELAMLFGIDDYHPTLADKPADGRQVAGSDYSMMLPNGVRLDVYGVSFDSFRGKVMGIVSREADPEHLTNFAAMYDRGTFVGSYTRSGDGAANKRFIVNSREIAHVTCPVGFIVTVTGLGTVYPALA